MGNNNNYRQNRPPKQERPKEAEAVNEPKEEYPPLPPEVEVVGVTFRSSTKTYFFDPVGLDYKVGDPIIVETARGLEFGKVTVANRTVSSGVIVPPFREAMRHATEADLRQNADNREFEKGAMKVFEEKIREHKLEMKPVSVEYTFDRQKLLFYFTAESRVDFRSLVKDLASVFRTRIELRQIGIRDEAKIMGGLGVCGRPFCCSSFLPDFVQVSMKMAKEQNFSLNTSKISGSCGRLMCCLRYEHEVYEEALKTIPPVGSLVKTPNGTGTVMETRPLEQTVRVRYEDKGESPKTFAVSEIQVLRHGKGGKRPDGGDTSDGKDRSGEENE